jgi:hypothetical protein
MMTPPFKEIAMARPALKNVSTASLQAELQRRATQLGKLLKVRDGLDRQIAELQTLAGAGRFGQAAAVAAPAGAAVKVGRKRGRKAKAATVAAAPVVREKGKRGHFLVNAQTFVLGLLEGRSLTTKDLIARWNRAGRGSKVDNVLTQLVKSGQVDREKVAGEQGSSYSLAGAAPKAAARQVVGKPAKRGKFAVTAGQFIINLLKGKALTTRQVNEAWKKAGRGGVADVDLSHLFKAGKIKREKLGGKLGSNYSLV